MNAGQLKVSLWTQWIAAFHVNVMTMLANVSMGLMSPLLAQLLGPNPPFEVTKEQTTWVASLLRTTKVFGPVLAMMTTISFGSKRTVHISGFLLTCAAISLIFANSIEVVYTYLLLNGLVMGIIISTIPVYIGEISDADIQGGLMTLAFNGYTTGHLLGTIVGTYLNIVNIGTFCLVLSSIYLISFSFFPHTPYYLVCQNKFQEASKSIEWYNRGIDTKVAAQEIDRLSKFAEQRLTIKGMLHEIKKPANRRVLIKLNIAFSMNKLNSMDAILEYLEILFVKANVTAIAPSSMVIIISVIGEITSWISIYTSDRFDRRNSALYSCTAMAFSLFTWGLCYQLQELGFNGSLLQYVVIASAITFRSGINFGLISVMGPITSEMLDPNIKSLGFSIGILNMALCSFISTKNFQFLLDVINYQYVFYINAVIVLLLGIYIKKMLGVGKGLRKKKVSLKGTHDEVHELV